MARYGRLKVYVTSERLAGQGVRLSKTYSYSYTGTGGTRCPADAGCYSTVTLFARLRGLSTSQPRATAM